MQENQVFFIQWIPKLVKYEYHFLPFLIVENGMLHILVLSVDRKHVIFSFAIKE